MRVPRLQFWILLLAIACGACKSQSCCLTGSQGDHCCPPEGCSDDEDNPAPTEDDDHDGGAASSYDAGLELPIAADEAGALDAASDDAAAGDVGMPEIGDE